jgi:hypothetical protein
VSQKGFEASRGQGSPYFFLAEVLSKPYLCTMSRGRIVDDGLSYSERAPNQFSIWNVLPYLAMPAAFVQADEKWEDPMTYCF